MAANGACRQQRPGPPPGFGPSVGQEAGNSLYNAANSSDSFANRCRQLKAALAALQLQHARTCSSNAAEAAVLTAKPATEHSRTSIQAARGPPPGFKAQPALSPNNDTCQQQEQPKEQRPLTLTVLGIYHSSACSHPATPSPKQQHFSQAAPRPYARRGAGVLSRKIRSSALPSPFAAFSFTPFDTTDPATAGNHQHATRFCWYGREVTVTKFASIALCRQPAVTDSLTDTNLTHSSNVPEAAQSALQPRLKLTSLRCHQHAVKFSAAKTAGTVRYSATAQSMHSYSLLSAQDVYISQANRKWLVEKAHDWQMYLELVGAAEAAAAAAAAAMLPFSRTAATNEAALEVLHNTLREVYATPQQGPGVQLTPNSSDSRASSNSVLALGVQPVQPPRQIRHFGPLNTAQSAAPALPTAAHEGLRLRRYRLEFGTARVAKWAAPPIAWTTSSTSGSTTSSTSSSTGAGYKHGPSVMFRQQYSQQRQGLGAASGAIYLKVGPPPGFQGRTTAQLAVGASGRQPQVTSGALPAHAASLCLTTSATAVAAATAAPQVPPVGAAGRQHQQVVNTKTCTFCTASSTASSASTASSGSTVVVRVCQFRLELESSSEGLPGTPVQPVCCRRLPPAATAAPAAVGDNTLTSDSCNDTSSGSCELTGKLCGSMTSKSSSGSDVKSSSSGGSTVQALGAPAVSQGNGYVGAPKAGLAAPGSVALGYKRLHMLLCGYKRPIAVGSTGACVLAATPPRPHLGTNSARRSNATAAPGGESEQPVQGYQRLHMLLCGCTVLPMANSSATSAQAATAPCPPLISCLGTNISNSANSATSSRGTVADGGVVGLGLGGSTSIGAPGAASIKDSIRGVAAGHGRSQDVQLQGYQHLHMLLCGCKHPAMKSSGSKFSNSELAVRACNPICSANSCCSRWGSSDEESECHGFDGVVGAAVKDQSSAGLGHAALGCSAEQPVLGYQRLHMLLCGHKKPHKAV